MAVSNSGGFIPSGTIKFDKEEMDVSNQFDKDTGVFEASEPGLYVFFFNADIKSSSAYFTVYLNGDVARHFNHYDDAGNQRILSGFWSMKLDANDEIYLSNSISNSIYIDSYHEMYFMGYRLNWVS